MSETLAVQGKGIHWLEATGKRAQAGGLLMFFLPHAMYAEPQSPNPLAHRLREFRLPGGVYDTVGLGPVPFCFTGHHDGQVRVLGVFHLCPGTQSESNESNVSN